MKKEGRGKKSPASIKERIITVIKMLVVNYKNENVSGFVSDCLKNEEKKQNKEAQNQENINQTNKQGI